MPAVPLTPEQKDAASAVKWFRSMGWQEAADAGACTCGSSNEPISHVGLDM